MTGAPILTVGYRALGDFVRTHSSVRLVAERHPGCPIDMLVPANTADAARAMAHVRKVFVFPSPAVPSAPRSLRDLAGALRAEGYQRAYIVPRSIKAALPAFLAGIPERVGYPFELRFGLVNILPPDWPKRLVMPNDGLRWRGVDQACDTVRDHSRPRPAHWPEPVMVASEADKAAARTACGTNPDDRVLAIYSAGLDNPRSWQVDRAAGIAMRFQDRGWKIWLVGGPRERDYVARLRTLVPDAVDCTDATLAVAIHQLAAADLYLGVDAGLSHVAAAVGTPCVIIFPAFASRSTGPINVNVVAIEPPVGASQDHTAPSAVPYDAVEQALDALARKSGLLD